MPWPTEQEMHEDCEKSSRQMEEVLTCIQTHSFRDLEVVDLRIIDERPCDALLTVDIDWGEQDSLVNVPRKEAIHDA